MTPEQYQKIKSIFYAACECDTDARAALLDDACGDDDEVRREVERLFRTEGCDPSFMEGPLLGEVVQQVAAEQATTPLPESIGGYRIVRRLGVGGMGIVYEAQQQEPRRRVALKVIAPAAMSPRQLQRFRQEAEVLGQLHHPGIAAIYEAGSADLGSGSQPFFAMELIEGPPLLEYAEHHGLGTRQRLEMMIRVCQAVHHAHQKGVIHRDLKPANILVEAVTDPGTERDAKAQHGQPKVLDFGIARATDSHVQTVTTRTGLGHLVGTVPYMSPEQAAGDARQLDIRSDVYSLGVIIFELLSGRLPHDLHGKMLHEALRTIREDDPSRLSSVSKLFRGDLDTIVARALAKERERRYDSAAALAADIRRYLDDEPIVARPPTTIYQLRKFAKRNRTLVAGVSGIVLALLIGTFASTMFALRSGRNANLAVQRQAIAERNAYRASITAAAAAILAHDVARAQEHLTAAPEHLRAWEWRHLASQLDHSLSLFDGPGKTVYPHQESVAFGAGGRQLFVAGAGLTTIEWPLDGAAREFVRSGALERYLGVSKDGKRVAVGTEDWHVEVRDASSGRVLDRRAELREWGETTESSGRGWIGCFVISSDGSTYAASRKWGGKTLVFRAHDDAEPVEIAATPIVDMDFSPDGTRIAVAVREGVAGVWNTRTGALEAELRGHEDELSSIAYGPHGRRIATASRDATVRIWDAASCDSLATLEGHTDRVQAVTFSPDGKTIASAGDDRTIRLWRAGDGATAGVLHGHERAVTALAFSPDGRHLASVADDGTTRIWSTSMSSEPSVLHGHRNYVYDVAFSPDGRRIASIGWGHYPVTDSALRLWDAATGDLIAAWAEECEGHAVWFDCSGARLAARCRSAVEVFDAATGRPVVEMPLRVVSRGAFAAVDRTRVDGWESSRNKNVVITDGSSDGPVAAHVGALSPDRSILAVIAGEQKQRVLVVDAASGRVGAELECGTVEQLRFSPTGACLAVACADTTVILWDVARAERLAILRGHNGPVLCVAFSPDDTRVATGSRDRTIRLWDMASFDEVIRLSGHHSYVKALAYSPDGETLVSASGDRTVRLWSTRTRRELHESRRQRAASVIELEPMVRRLFAELGDADAVVRSLASDRSLGERAREIALQLTLGESRARMASDERGGHSRE